MLKFRHVGCGTQPTGATNKGFALSEWEEVRFGIAPSVSPDVTMTAMIAIGGGKLGAFSTAQCRASLPARRSGMFGIAGWHKGRLVEASGGTLFHEEICACRPSCS